MVMVVYKYQMYPGTTDQTRRKRRREEGSAGGGSASASASDRRCLYGPPLALAAARCHEAALRDGVKCGSDVDIRSLECARRSDPNMLRIGLRTPSLRTRLQHSSRQPTTDTTTPSCFSTRGSCHRHPLIGAHHGTIPFRACTTTPRGMDWSSVQDDTPPFRKSCLPASSL